MATSAQIRDELEDLLVRDLLGPADGLEEVIVSGSVHDRYLVGILAPKGHVPDSEPSEDIALAGDDAEDGEPEAPLPTAIGMMFPSSIGLTFAISPTATALQVTASWGRYRRFRVERDAGIERDEGVGRDAGDERSTDRLPRRWPSGSPSGTRRSGRPR